MRGQVPPRLLEECKILAYDEAKFIVRARLFNMSDSQIRGRPVLDSAHQAVRGLMIHLTEKYPTLTEKELATEAYSYCVARK